MTPTIWTWRTIPTTNWWSTRLWWAYLMNNLWQYILTKSWSKIIVKVKWGDLNITRWSTRIPI